MTNPRSGLRGGACPTAQRAGDPDERAGNVVAGCEGEQTRAQANVEAARNATSEQEEAVAEAEKKAAEAEAAITAAEQARDEASASAKAAEGAFEEGDEARHAERSGRERSATKARLGSDGASQAQNDVAAREEERDEALAALDALRAGSPARKTPSTKRRKRLRTPRVTSTRREQPSRRQQNALHRPQEP